MGLGVLFPALGMNSDFEQKVTSDCKPFLILQFLVTASLNRRLCKLFVNYSCAGGLVK